MLSTTVSTFNEADVVRDQAGKFAPNASSSSSVQLQAPQDTDWRAQRAAQLASMGYAPPIATGTRIDPASTRDIGEWWNTSFVDAEYGHGAGDYPLMPDDNTPGMTGGNAISGHRRTHRMSYSGNGVTLRMPSKTAIHRFSASQHDRTFDVPVSASLPDGSTVQGTVRVTRGSDGQWETKGLGFNPEHEVYVAEGVAAVLEGQRARTSLRAAGDLMQRRQERLAAGGSKPIPVESSWIRSVGYTADGNGPAGSGVMTLTTKEYVRKDGTSAGAKTYGYKVDANTFSAMLNSEAPGKVFNRFVRGAEGAQIRTCEKCGLMTANAQHQCATKVSPRRVEDGDVRSPQRLRASWAMRLRGKRRD